MPKRITIKDIADRAGVSTGTVDRILHNRGNVSKRSRAAVEKVLADSDYSSGTFNEAIKPCVLAVVAPTSTTGDYWSSVYGGISLAVKEFFHPGIKVEYFRYNQFDVYSCLSVQNEMLRQHPDAVIIGPTFMEEAQSFCASLDQAGIPYIFVDSFFENASPLASFFTDQISGGRAVAHLISAFTESGGELAVFESPRSGARLSNNSRFRLDGFREYLKSTGREKDLVGIRYISTFPEENEKTLKELLSSHEKLRGIAVLNSRGSAIAESLEKLGGQGIKVVSFDLTKSNIECLRKGTIDALVCQHPSRQGYQAAHTLLHYLVHNTKPDSKQYIMPINIVLKETVDNYVEYD